ncbi:MAG: hypothetical protein ISEC1_P0182 [Thiomicrorhabdus sp.]|nr:MAG: hypothetical protein ISEC1_P0182 [Thiomicrorhabdus sp.]
MKKIEKSILLPYTAEQIYSIVNNVAEYPEFLPWCDHVKVLSESRYEMIASITVSKAGISQTFKTRNRLTEGKRIEMFLLEGPFKALDGVWEFRMLEDGNCLVRFEVEYEASYALLNATIGPVFSASSTVMLNALNKRAQVLYG